MNKVKEFFTKNIWFVQISRLPKRNALWVLCCRVLALTTKFFIQNKCALHASALTFFTLLSLVPIAALFFGIAKGYGFEEVMKTKLHESMPGQEQAVEKVIQFADNALNKASGGVVAGFGVLLLFWTALKLLSNIEGSFNEIWGVRRGRTWLRKLSDYITLLLLCPLLLIALATSSTFVVARLQSLSAMLPFGEVSNQLILCLTKLIPFIIAWGTFTFLYMFIPNTKVKFRAAVISGFITGAIYTILQFGYIYLQKILTGYNAIYGSFAALPFFLVWLQSSWSIILLGAQITFSVQNVNIYELCPENGPVSSNAKSICVLRIMKELAERFERQQGPTSVQFLSEKLEIPIRLVRTLLFDLTECGLIVRVMSDDKAPELYQVCIAPEKLTPVYIFRRLADHGDDTYPAAQAEDARQLVNSLWLAAENSGRNQVLVKPGK